MKIGLTGSTGRLGSTLLKYPHLLFTPLDFRIESKLNLRKEIFTELKNKNVDKVIHCAAYTDVCAAEMNPYECWLVNTFGTAILASVCSYQFIPLIYISTDHVFDGEKGMYKETDPVSPVGNYALSKAIAEDIVLQYPMHTVIRTSFIKSFPLPAAFTDKYFSGDTAEVIADEIVRCVGMDLRGLIHIGTGRKSIYDVAKKISPEVKEMKLSDNPINKVGLKYLKDSSLDTTRWEKAKEEYIRHLEIRSAW